MKAYLLDKGISVNKLGKGALQRQYAEMLKYMQTGEIPERLHHDEENL